MARNEIKTKFGTPIVWTDTDGDRLMDLGNLAAGGLVMGAFLDLGKSPRQTLYTFELLIDGFASAPVIGETISLKFALSNAQDNFDGNPSTDPTATAQGTITANQAKNLTVLGGVCVVYSVTASDILKISGIVELYSRYVSPVVENNTVDALLATADAHKLTLIRVSSDIEVTA